MLCGCRRLVLSTSSRTLLKAIAVLAACMFIFLVFHIGDIFALRIGQFAQLVGAITGGGIALISVLRPIRSGESCEPWLAREKTGWILIGCGVLMWGLGESFWRYYILAGQSPFPSLADIGYSSFPILVFGGLLLQPAADKEEGHRRVYLLLDSLASMGAILAIAWYLLLGSLAQAPGEANLAKFLGIYYPTTDLALLSCVIFLLLRGSSGRIYQVKARRASLMYLGLGLCCFVFSDFVFNIQNNAGSYVDATWVDLGWPLGMMIIGFAAHLRRFLPATSEDVVELRMQLLAERTNFAPAQFLPYALLGILLLVLTINVLSTDSGQLAIRPVLLLVTLSVVALIVARQILTLLDNAHLAMRQSVALENLEKANKFIEEQANQIKQHTAELGLEIEHLEDVQSNLAKGNLRVRAQLSRGELVPLAASLNLMAERLSRLWQSNEYARHLQGGLNDLSSAFEGHWLGRQFTMPESYHGLLEIERLLAAMHIRPTMYPSNIQSTPIARTNQEQSILPRRPKPAMMTPSPAPSLAYPNIPTRSIERKPQEPEPSSDFS